MQQLQPAAAKTNLSLLTGRLDQLLFEQAEEGLLLSASNPIQLPDIFTIEALYGHE